VLLGTHRTTLDGPGESSDGANCRCSDFVVGHSSVVSWIAVVAMKDIVSIEPLVVTVGPDQ
jgi:hypothetical protein